MGSGEGTNTQKTETARQSTYYSVFLCASPLVF